MSSLSYAFDGLRCSLLGRASWYLAKSSVLTAIYVLFPINTQIASLVFSPCSCYTWHYVTSSNTISAMISALVSGISLGE